MLLHLPTLACTGVRACVTGPARNRDSPILACNNPFLQFPTTTCQDASRSEVHRSSCCQDGRTRTASQVPTTTCQTNCRHDVHRSRVGTTVVKASHSGTTSQTPAPPVKPPATPSFVEAAGSKAAETTATREPAPTRQADGHLEVHQGSSRQDGRTAPPHRCRRSKIRASETRPLRNLPAFTLFRSATRKAPQTSIRNPQAPRTATSRLGLWPRSGYRDTELLVG